MIPGIERYRLAPHMTNIIKFQKSIFFPTVQMEVACKWHFSTAGDTANLRGASGDRSEHRGRGFPLLGINSQSGHCLTGLTGTWR